MQFVFLQKDLLCHTSCSSCLHMNVIAVARNAAGGQEVIFLYRNQ